ncbi:large conductance mechanosensitive channel protein MscL [Mycoplasmopsis cricetuli]|uniref:large conductance mechanosensitive channel protein MscL n=1 Tax=Mycoplasmopsis cricetuli TaxID=171283 RepID=UPI0004B37FAE|nr:MscL family protein [Mycoplasmopsis cricetuli]
MKKIFRKAFYDAKGHLKKGNIFMLAVAFILGSVFSALVSSFANDILMGLINYLSGFDKKGDEIIKYGMNISKFVGSLMYFIIVTLFVFVFLLIYYLIKRLIESRKPVVEEIKPEPKPTIEEQILTELKQLNVNLTNKK